MPSSSGVQSRGSTFNLPGKYDLRSALPVALAIVLALLVAAPWLQVGYLFGTDWPGPRRFELPSEISSSAPVELVLVGIARLAGAEVVGKILVLAILAGG